MRNPTEEQIESDILWKNEQVIERPDGVKLYRYSYRSRLQKRTSISPLHVDPCKALVLLKDKVAEGLEMYP